MIRAKGLRKVYKTHGGSYTAIDDISVDIPMGMRLGLLGRNGAGKSTLIRLLSKIELPTSGRVEHHMSVSWPLGFSGSFQGSLTGLDNMRFIARIYGVDYAWLKKFVEDFSELGQFLYQPVKTYSSGMRARLGFALSIAIDFDCYLIDEVIMVGDQRFHARCREHLFNKTNNRSLIIASHDMGFIHEMCNAAMIVEKGRATYYSNVDQALEIYKNL